MKIKSLAHARLAAATNDHMQEAIRMCAEDIGWQKCNSWRESYEALCEVANATCEEDVLSELETWLVAAYERDRA